MERKRIKDTVLKIPILNTIVKKYHFTSRVQKEIFGCKSVLELGCGHISYVSSMKPRPYSVGIDLFEPSLIEAKKNNVLDEYFLMNVMEIGEKFKENEFDCIIAMDLIEHLTKEDGLKLIEMANKIAKKKIIIYTPNGYLKQDAQYGNPWQEHKSGWSVQEMKALGFKVTGSGGLKWLRPQFAVTKKPVWFWKSVSNFSHLFTITKPELAFQILCVKDCSHPEQ